MDMQKNTQKLTEIEEYLTKYEEEATYINFSYAPDLMKLLITIGLKNKPIECKEFDATTEQFTILLVQAINNPHQNIEFYAEYGGYR